MANTSSTSALLQQSFMAGSEGGQPQQVNITFIIEIISALHEVYHYKTFILYISAYLDLSSEWAAEFFAHFFGAFPLVPSIVIISGNKTLLSMPPMRVRIRSPSLSLVFTTGQNDPVMALTAESMQRVHILQTIFILSPVMASKAVNDNRFWQFVSATYGWIWHEQFLNTILLTIRDHVYILNPYPELNIINKTGSWHVEDFFVDYYHDFKGYLLNTVAHYDMPRLFERRYERNKLIFSGTSGKLFTSFIKFINATLIDAGMVTSSNHTADRNVVKALIANRTVESSPHSFTEISPSEHVGTSYPIGINDWFIIAPFYNRSPEHLYLQRCFQYSTWLLVLFAVIYISIALWLCTPKRHKEFSATLLQAICLMLCIPTTSAFNTPNPRMCFLFVSIFLLGFITTNWYVTKIASYLATSLPSPQLDTVDDVVRANLRIKVFDYEYESLRSMPVHYPPRFLQQVDIVDKVFMDRHRDKLNTSFGYSMQTDRWKFLKMQQQSLRQPLFRRTDISMGPFYHVFLLNTDTHLEQPLKNFIMHATQSGFLTFWQKVAFADALRLDLVRNILIHEEARPLSMRFLLPIWYVWGLGITISAIFFCGELSQARFKRKLLLNFGSRVQKP